ncbi:MAG: AsmA family protein, partial [Janthinobacterium lividum]
MPNIAHRRRWPFVVGGLVALVIVAALVFRWDWLIPTVERRASAAIGRAVTIQHLHVALGRKTRIEAEGVTIANPPDWTPDASGEAGNGAAATSAAAASASPANGLFATAERLGLDLDALALIRHRQIVLPVIDIQAPRIDLRQRADGRNNYTFVTPSSGDSSGPETKLGVLRIADGQVRAVLAKLAADFKVAVETQDSKDGTGQISAQAQGTYAAQPIKASFLGGALLSLRDAATPYPVNLDLSNGPTRITLAGTVQDPFAFKGTSLKLDLSGPSMDLLMPLTGIALPATPPYRV